MNRIMYGCIAKGGLEEKPLPYMALFLTLRDAVEWAEQDEGSYVIVKTNVVFPLKYEEVYEVG